MPWIPAGNPQILNVCPGILDQNSCPGNQRGRITRQLPKPKNEVWGETWQKPRPKTRACHTGWWRLGDQIKTEEIFWPQGEAGGSKI